MENSAGIERKSRFRFSLGTLLLAVTALGGCFAALQLRFRIRDSEWIVDEVRNVVERLPVGGFSMHFVLQIVTLGIASLALYLWRQPSMLWLYAASKVVWLSTVALGFGLQSYLSLQDSLHEAILIVFFFETTCGLVFALMAFGQSLFRRKLARVLTCLLILLLNLLAEFCSIVELDAFASALAARIVGAT
jgi:hypothetical protein